MQPVMYRQCTAPKGMAPIRARSGVAGTQFSVARMQRGEASPRSSTTNLALAGGGKQCSRFARVSKTCREAASSRSEPVPASHGMTPARILTSWLGQQQRDMRID